MVQMYANTIRQPNMMGAYAAAEQIKGSRATREAAAAERERTAAANQLAGAYMAGDESALPQVAGLDADLAIKLQNMTASMNEAQREQMQEKTTYMGSLAEGIMSVDAIRRPMLWQQALAGMAERGYDTSKMQPHWDESMLPWVQSQAHQARSISDWMTLNAPDKTLVKTMGPDGMPVWTPRSEAAGMSAQPPSSTEFVSDGKGGFTLRLGGAPGQGAPLTTSTETAAQKKVLDVGDIQAQLTAIDQGFRPEFQQYGTKLETVWTNFKSKAGFTVSAEERQLAEDFAAHRANAGRVFSTILNDISGVAVNPEEFKRAEAFIPNPGKGIGDGDSPIEFETKLRAMQEYTKKAMAKYTYITRNGLTINDVDMDDMQGLMNERGDELRAAYGDRGLKGDALKQAVRQQLGFEFGMAVQ